MGVTSKQVADLEQKATQEKAFKAQNKAGGIKWAKRGATVIRLISSIKEKKPYDKWETASNDYIVVGNAFDDIHPSIIGVLNGKSGYLTIDIDDEATYKKLVSDHPDILDTYRECSRSGKGKKHLIYKDMGLKYKNGVRVFESIYPSVDIRGWKGLTLVAPSIDNIGECKCENDVDPIAMPTWLIEMLDKANLREDATNYSDKPCEITTLPINESMYPPCIKEMIRVLKSEPRKDTHNGLGAEENVLLSSFLLAANNSTNQVCDVFKSGTKYNEKITRSNVEYQLNNQLYIYKCSNIKSWNNCICPEKNNCKGGTPYYTYLDKIVVKENPYPPFKLKPLHELLKNPAKIKWLVQDFLPEHGKLLISGPPKVFKSTIAVDDLAVSVASGKPYLGKFKTNIIGPVIVYQGENLESLESDRFKKIMHNKGISEDEKLPLYFISGQNLVLNDPDSLKRLKEAITEINPVLVLIDPLYMAFKGSMSKDEDTVPVLQELTNIRDLHKCAIGIATHDPKDGKVFGSVFFQGWYECAYLLESDKANESEWGTSELITNIAESQIKIPSKTIILERLGRMLPSMQKLAITIKMGLPGELLYDLQVGPYNKNQNKKEKKALTQDDMDNDIVGMVKIHPGETATTIANRLKGYYREKNITARMPELVNAGKIRSKGLKIRGAEYYPVKDEIVKDDI